MIAIAAIVLLTIVAIIFGWGILSLFASFADALVHAPPPIRVTYALSACAIAGLATGSFIVLGVAALHHGGLL